MASFATPEVIITIALSSLALGWFVSPPLVVVVRNVRPILSTVGIFVWLVFRFVNNTKRSEIENDPAISNESLLRLFIDVLDQLHEWFQTKMSNVTTFLPLLSLCFRLFEDLLAVVMVVGFSRIVYCLYHYTWKDWNELVVDGIFERIKELPFVSDQLNSFVDIETMNHALGRDPHRTITRRLPSNGRPGQELVKELESHATIENKKWIQGKVSGTVYPRDEQHTELMSNVYKIYSWANPLHFK